MTIHEQAVEAGTRAVIERANVRASCSASEICVSAPCPCAEDIARAVIAAALPLVGVQRPDREAVARVIFDKAVGLSKWDNKFYYGERDGCFETADAILALPHTGQPQKGDHERETPVVPPIGQERLR